MKEGQGLAKSAGGSLGGLAGGIAGAKAGGVAGGLIGSFVGPWGTLIGGVIGSLIGGAIGYLAGGKLGEMLPGLYQTFMGTYLKILETVIRGIVFAIGLSIGLLVRGISSIPGIVTGLYNSLVSGLGYVLQSLKTFVVNLFNEETRNQMIQGFKTGLSNLVSLVTSELTGFGRRVWQAFRGGYERGRREQPLDLNPRNNLPGAEPQYKGSFGTDSFMPLPRAIATEIKHKPPGSELVIANDSELIIPTKAAYSGSGDIGVIVNPLQGINTKTSSVIQYLNLVRSQINTSGNQTVSSISNARTEQTGVMRQVNSSINTGTIDVVSTLRQVLTYLSALVGSFTGTMDVRVVNTPTVNMSMGVYGPIGGSVGNFPKTSGFGQRWGRLHAGNDYGMPVGTRLAIGGPGTVLRSGYWGGYGLAMDIGGPGGMVYRFAHLSRFLAPPGAMLPPGVPFALSGNTGRSTGPHLHFEARPGGGGPVNPDPYAGIIRANYKGMGLSSIMDATKNELSNMPYGSNLVVGNSSELIMRPNQVGNLVESATRAGVEGSRNVTITGLNININGANKSGKELANEIASHILGAIESANYTEIYT
jgi:murein DD-endopeptidase MepM/ murein hydrolase activator NlpD